MKICLVSDQLVGFHKEWSGAEMVCDYCAKVLKKYGQSLIFITTSASEKKKMPGVFQIPRVKNKSPLLRKILAPLMRLIGVAYSFYYLYKEKPDVIHFFHSNYVFIPVMIGARILKIPTVFSVLDYFIICPRNNLRLNNGRICEKSEGRQCLECVSTLKFLEKKIVNHFFRKINKLITFTETSKARLIKHGITPEKIEVIYTYGVSDSPVKREAVESNSILFVGTFFKYKGLDVLIEAMEQVAKEVPEAKLKIAGIGYAEDKKRLEKLIEDAGVGKNIEFLGRKKNAEILDLISQSEMLVVPEQWPSDFGPLILVEAMAMSKSVIASDIGTIPEFIKNGINGFLAEHGNSKKFAEKIIYLVKNKKAANLLGERAQKDILSFLNHDQGKMIIQCYNEILNNNIR